MASNYPAGSMRGSGIYSYDYEEERGCQDTTCDFVGKVLIDVDDWGTHSWECPTCGYEQEIDLDAEDPANEYEPDRYLD